jgi:hypothetical protein
MHGWGARRLDAAAEQSDDDTVAAGWPEQLPQGIDDAVAGNLGRSCKANGRNGKRSWSKLLSLPAARR